MKTILAPIDLSPVSKAVAAEAAALARAFHGRLVLLTVIQPMGVESEFVGMYGNAADIAIAEKSAESLLAECERQVAAEGIPVESVQVAGLPISSIIDQARQLRADYIVMGSHGHGALYELLMGSTTHGVLLRATCPVVIVRPSASMREPENALAAEHPKSGIDR